jgi:predicted nucleic acid-binding protein
MNDASAFFDTDVLLYLVAGDASKAERAEELIAGSGVVSAQVLNEFAAVATRKQRMSLSEVREVLGAVRANCRVESLSAAMHDRGLAIAERYGLSIYDAMIVSAASLSGCHTLYSEDLQHGQVIERLTIRNPFLAGAGNAPA